jgi:hypothetical protein
MHPATGEGGGTFKPFKVRSFDFEFPEVESVAEYRSTAWALRFPRIPCNEPSLSQALFQQVINDYFSSSHALMEDHKLMEPIELDILAWKITELVPGFRVVGEHRSNLRRLLKVTDPVSNQTLHLAFQVFPDMNPDNPRTFNVYLYGKARNVERMHRLTPEGSDGTPYYVQSAHHTFPHVMHTVNEHGEGQLVIPSVPWGEFSLICALLKQLILTYLYHAAASPGQ